MHEYFIIVFIHSLLLLMNEFVPAGPETACKKKYCATFCTTIQDSRPVILTISNSNSTCTL